MQRAKVRVWFTNSNNSVEFDNWFDIADYIKQENLKRRDVSISRWVYVRPQSREDVCCY